MGQEVVPRLRSFAQLRKLRPGAGRCVVQDPTVAGTGNSAFLTPWPVLAVPPLPVPFRGTLRSLGLCSKSEPHAGPTFCPHPHPLFPIK